MTFFRSVSLKSLFCRIAPLTGSFSFSLRPNFAEKSVPSLNCVDPKSTPEKSEPANTVLSN